MDGIRCKFVGSIAFVFIKNHPWIQKNKRRYRIKEYARNNCEKKQSMISICPIIICEDPNCVFPFDLFSKQIKLNPNRYPTEEKTNLPEQTTPKRRTTH